MKTRRILLYAILLSVVLSPLSAQESTAPTHSVAAVSAAFPLAADAIILSQLAIPRLQSIAPWIANPLTLGAHVPMYWLNPGRAGIYTAAGLALPAAGISLMFATGGDPFAGEWSNSILSAYKNLMLYSSYDIYTLAGSEDGDGLGRLAAAPFSSAIIDPLVWIPSVVGPTVLTAWYLLFERDGAVSVEDTGTAYIGSTPVSPIAGGAYTFAKAGLDLLAVSIGEEAYYRGVLYESALRRFGRPIARGFDAVLFPLIHLAADVQTGFRPMTLLFNFAWRSGMTLVFDAAYEKGGLPLSVAVHYWSDLVLLMSRWWFYGGAQ